MAQGIWQESDHRPVTAAEATREWTLRAQEVLAEVAGRWGRSIEYADVAAEVQRRSGIRTDMAADTWLDDVLAEVDARCREASKPSLLALVDQPDASLSGENAARLACYEAYGAKPPRAPRASAGRSAGARPRATKAAGTTPTRKSPRREERPRPVCPTCFVELPGTGICDDCD